MKVFNHSIFSASAAIMILASAMLLSPVAGATPGDVLCNGQTANKKKVEVYLGYDRHGQPTASFIEISIDDVQIVKFPEAALEGKMVNVGTEANPFMNWTQGGKDGENMVTLRYPEQDPDAEGMTIMLTLDVPSKKVSLIDLEVTCNN